MIHSLVPNRPYYRVTTGGRKWADVLSGRGSLYLPGAGNRYNVVLQQAAYVADDLAVAVTEFAYYAALEWQLRIGNHHVLPVSGPLQSDYILWQFTLQNPTYVVDVENAPGLPGQLPPFALLNPSRNYAATQHLTNQVVNAVIGGHGGPHPGLKVPAVRTRHGPAATESNYVLFRIGNSPAGTLTGRWKLRIEFLDIVGNPVTAGSPRVDWAHPHFILLASRGKGGAAVSPAPYALQAPVRIHINFL